MIKGADQRDIFVREAETTLTQYINENASPIIILELQTLSIAKISMALYS